MIEKMMDPNIIDYNIINCAIPLIITIKNRYQIDFGKPVFMFCLLYFDKLMYACKLTFHLDGLQRIKYMNFQMHCIR